jgi:hypothetical protein
MKKNIFNINLIFVFVFVLGITGLVAAQAQEGIVLPQAQPGAAPPAQPAQIQFPDFQAWCQAKCSVTVPRCEFISVKDLIADATKLLTDEQKALPEEKIDEIIIVIIKKILDEQRCPSDPLKNYFRISTEGPAILQFRSEFVKNEPSGWCCWGALLPPPQIKN